MLSTAIQRGLLRLRITLSKIKMADMIPKESGVTDAVPKEMAVAEVVSKDTSATEAVSKEAVITDMIPMDTCTSVTTDVGSKETTLPDAAPKETTVTNMIPKEMDATIVLTKFVEDGHASTGKKRAIEPESGIEPSAVHAAGATETVARLDGPAAKKLKTEDESTSVKLNKVVKRKVAMLLAYSGVGYKGMQRNPGEKTIEEDLAAALLKCEAIDEEQAANFGKMSFQRCARTDKGVSAAGQVVSLKMKLLENVMGRINEYLPPCIRVMGIKRTTASFNSKHNCDYRSYIYMMPTFAFQPIEEVTTESYRITEDKLTEVNSLLSQYLGTHNFHNFTSGKVFKDPSAKRFIREFKCNDPFMSEDLEFVILRVKGQSFVLHQIRKMIALVVAIAKGFTPKSTLQKAFLEERLDIPRAPGLGLVLESVHYDAYNRRWGNDGMHEPLTWDECEEKLEQFKKQYIHSTIVNKEKTERSMMQWLGTLAIHTFDDTQTRNPYRETYQQIEQKRKEMKEQLHMPEASQASTESQLPEKKESGPEVTSTTGPGSSKQDGGLDKTLHVASAEAECLNLDSSKVASETLKSEGGISADEENASKPDDGITSSGLNPDSEKTVI